MEIRFNGRELSPQHHHSVIRRRTCCPRCSGLIVSVYEWNSYGLQVIKCVLCGWRVYPDQSFVDPDTAVELLTAMVKDQDRTDTPWWLLPDEEEEKPSDTEFHTTWADYGGHRLGATLAATGHR